MNRHPNWKNQFGPIPPEMPCESANGTPAPRGEAAEVSRKSATQRATPVPEAIDHMRDPAASYWLKDALASAMNRDPVDAALDAELLASILMRRAREVLEWAVQS
jgi:hypothetical protein